MRPYKKRSFQSQLQSSENIMETENSEDSEKQVSSSPPIEDVEKDKDKEGETKRRKRWKRKISRKQFRHHDIKLFTPNEYRTSSLLKQKDTSPTIPKKPDGVSKESITELIVTSLGGQKQVSTQKKGQMEEVVDSTTTNDTEENNNANGVQNNNNVGKHNLPAIIMETPSMRRRSVDNTNIPKTNSKNTDPKFTRRMSVDMPMLNLSEKITENPTTQPQITESRQEKSSARNNGSRFIADGPTNVGNRNAISDMETNRYPVEHVPGEEVHNLSSKGVLLNSTVMEQNYPVANPEYKGTLAKNHIAERRLEQNVEPMETSMTEEMEEPENLSLKRRHSTEIPVDLSKKNSAEQRPNHCLQKPRQNDDLKHMNVETNKNMGKSYSPMDCQRTVLNGPTDDIYLEEYVRNNPLNHERMGPTLLRPNVKFTKEGESSDQNRPNIVLHDDLVKIANLNMWKEVLQRLLKQSFTLEILELISHAYEQVEIVKEESCIPVELKLKTQKLLSEAYSFVSDKLQQLNVDVSPAFVIKILGQTETTPEKKTLKHYMENMQRIRKLAIDENEATVSKIPTSEFSHAASYSQNYTELPSSHPSSYSAHINQSRYHKNSNDNHLPGAHSSKTSDHAAPLGHRAGSALRDENHQVSSSYSRGSSPRTGDYPKSVGHSRGSSPKTGDHPMTVEPPPRFGDYPTPQGSSRGPSPRNSDHSVPQGLLQRTGDYPSPRNGEQPISFGHPGGSAPRTGDYQMPLRHPEGPFSRNAQEVMQQGYSQRPPARSADHYMPLNHSGESPLRSGNRYMPTGYSERPSAGTGDHSVPLSYPRNLQFQHPGAYINYPSDLNPTPFLNQSGRKEPITRSPAPVGRPRSKSHRNTDIKGPQPHLRRSISNPQHPAMETPLLTHPYLEGAINRMPPPKVPTSSHNFYPPSPTLLPNAVQNKELPITPSTTAPPSKPNVPSIYSEVFYQNLHNHMSKGNPLAISVHPHPRYQKKAPNAMPNIHRLEINERQKGLSNVQDVHQKISEQHAETNKPSVPLVTSSVEENISSSTDHIEISKVSNASRQPAYEPVSLQDPAPPKPTETIKSIPVAVIVADKSMQITKETTATSGEGQGIPTSLDAPEDTDVRISVSSNSNENTSGSEENLNQAFDKEQEENNTEFLVWLEKLKSNEKLKSKFLSQMGIIKKEEPAFLPASDPIEIIDSDEENSSELQTSKRSTPKPTETSQKNLSNQTPNDPQKSGQVRLASRPNYIEQPIPHETPVQTTVLSNTVQVNKVSSVPELSKEMRNPSPKESLSKNDYIPPIPLPYIPTPNGQNMGYSSASIPENKKVIYSPEIEPISPVGNEPSFIFPEVSNAPKLLPPLNINSGERSNIFPNNVTSPTYPKRKNPLDFPGYQSEESINTKSDYPNDNAVKRRKSLERPEITKSPRIAPSGKLCYVRESHMFLRYFDDTQVELFIRNLSTQDEELLRSTGIEPEQFKSTHKLSKFGLDQLAKTEIIYLPRDVEFSEKEDIPEVEEFIKETGLVEQFVPKDFADFYRYVTGFQIIKNKHPVSLQTFLTMYNTNRTSELLRKYLERDDVTSRTTKR